MWPWLDPTCWIWIVLQKPLISFWPPVETFGALVLPQCRGYTFWTESKIGLWLVCWLSLPYWVVVVWRSRYDQNVSAIHPMQVFSLPHSSIVPILVGLPSLWVNTTSDVCTPFQWPSHLCSSANTSHHWSPPSRSYRQIGWGIVGSLVHPVCTRCCEVGESTLFHRIRILGWQFPVLLQVFLRQLRLGFPQLPGIQWRHREQCRYGRWFQNPVTNRTWWFRGSGWMENSRSAHCSE